MLDLGSVHLAAGWSALACGLFNLLAPKGTWAHRGVGCGFVISMVVTNVVALSLYRLTGHFNMFHVFAVISLAATIAALIPALQRRPGWVVHHRRRMKGAYTGLCAAAANEILMRYISHWIALPLETFWTLSILVTSAVTLGGVAIIWRGERMADA